MFIIVYYDVLLLLFCCFEIRGITKQNESVTCWNFEQLQLLDVGMLKLCYYSQLWLVFKFWKLETLFLNFTTLNILICCFNADIMEFKIMKTQKRNTFEMLWLYVSRFFLLILHVTHSKVVIHVNKHNNILTYILTICAVCLFFEGGGIWKRCNFETLQFWKF